MSEAAALPLAAEDLGDRNGRDKGDERQGIQSIEVGAILLEVLARSSGPLSLRDLSAEAGMTPSKAHRYLVSLIRCGLVEKEPVSGHYDLGGMSLRLGLTALNRLDVVQIATEEVRTLNQQLDLTSFLAVWGTHGPTVVALRDSSELVITSMKVGANLPLFRSATGRVFLAYMPRKTVAPFVERELQSSFAQLPQARVRSLADVDDVVSEVRARRLGATYGDVVPGLSALAGPIFDHQGQLVAAIGVIGASKSVQPEEPSSPTEILLKAVDGVSERLGWWHHAPGESYVERMEAHAAGAE
ncbi:IclR family transcriptional regulator [Acuticoccus kandeliae]|uniref:IclR family transcriptional regulator n=1 Tax=Acuticoccus kandeliae TaxID=2073160 RepID=UPI001472A7F2|nr:IclR family transcriptional regulator [Acuticoccus kandeliae]